MLTRLLTHRRAVVVAATFVVVVAVVFGFAPARQAAAEFLSIFRVQRFEVVEVAPFRESRMKSLEQILETGALGEPAILREASAPETVPDLATASARSGLALRTVGDLDQDVTLTQIQVAVGPHLRLDLEREGVELALRIAGIEDVALPAFDRLPVEIDVPAMVEQRYDIGGTEVTLVQMASPEATLPPGIPSARLGEAYLRLLGLDAAAAAEMAAEIDWTSTMVIPVPTNEGSARRIDVNGAPGILFEEYRHDNPDAETLVLWERDGVILALGSDEATASLLTRVAAAVR